VSDYGPLVVFKSIPEFWTIERNGNKPNTVRLLTESEYVERLDFARACLDAGEPATICIVNAANPADIFYRRITSIEQIGTILGQTVWVISWRHEDGPGIYIDPEEADSE
jgi:hypothetical protein